MSEIPYPDIPYPDFLQNSLLTSPPPLDPIQQVDRLAYDLAIGAMRGHWNIYGLTPPVVFSMDFDTARLQSNITSEQEYLAHTWIRYGVAPPKFDILVVFGFMALDDWGYGLTPYAFELLRKPAPHSIFISYRRICSSPIAMLLWSELRASGYKVFLDVSEIAPGDKWHTMLENRVIESTHFIPVICADSFVSNAIADEIRWAMESSSPRRIMPVLHSGFTIEMLRSSPSPFRELAANDLIELRTDTASELYGMIERIRYTLQH